MQLRSLGLCMTSNADGKESKESTVSLHKYLIIGIIQAIKQLIIFIVKRAFCVVECLDTASHLSI